MSYNPTDEELSNVIRLHTRLARQAQTVEDEDESYAIIEEAKDLLKVRHPLGVSGREGLPDQG